MAKIIIEQLLDDGDVTVKVEKLADVRALYFLHLAATKIFEHMAQKAEAGQPPSDSEGAVTNNNAVIN